MRNRLLPVLFLMVAVCCHAEDLKLWYGRPAVEWTEALPVGNSRMSAMVYGGTATETIQFNEETFWSGGPYNNDSPEALASLPEVRRLIFAGREKEAEQLMSKTFMTGKYGMVFLPAGNLREPIQGKNRAQIIIVTKCPPDIKPIDFNIIGKRLCPYPYQQLYFSGLRYGQVKPVFPTQADRNNTFALKGNEQVLLVTGIASPAPLLREVKARAASVQLLEFGDHHDFSKKDFQLIDREFSKLSGPSRLIITTEKDGARLKNHPGLPEALKPHLYMLPVEIKILQNQQQIFNQNIINYVRTHSRNSQLPEGKDVHTA